MTAGRFQLAAFLFYLAEEARVLNRQGRPKDPEQVADTVGSSGSGRGLQVAKRASRSREGHGQSRSRVARPVRPAVRSPQTGEAGEGEKPCDGRFLSRERGRSRERQAVERSAVLPGNGSGVVKR
jgi:hypothetical protein